MLANHDEATPDTARISGMRIVKGVIQFKIEELTPQINLVAQAKAKNFFFLRQALESIETIFA